MVEDTSPAQDMVDVTAHVVHQNVSYDKDVVEINLADSVDSSGYGGNFVKDVCIDEGQRPHRKISEEKVVDEKSSINFDFLMIDANGVRSHGEKYDSKKSVYELTPETVLVPVGYAPAGNNEKLKYSSRKECDLEDRSISTDVASNPSEKKISLEELLRLENAEESQRTCTISSQSENHMPSIHGEAVGQIPINDCHGGEAIASKIGEIVTSTVPSKDNTNGCPVTTSEEHDAVGEFNLRGPNQVNHYNAFVNHGPPGNTCKLECSVPATTDAAAEKTDSFSNIVTDSKGFREAETAESRVADALCSSSSYAQSSERSNYQNEILVSETITGSMDEPAEATTSSASNEEPSRAKGEDHTIQENDCVADVHDFKQRDEEKCLHTRNSNAVSKSSTQEEKDIVGDQSAPDSAKATARIVNGYPFEPDLFGPSIMSAQVSNSGHIAYSGNISIRSDSSTTSTRSFAFPVLQRDWISSPVRMAKGERRRIRRRHGWRKGLFCCKF